MNTDLSGSHCIVNHQLVSTASYAFSPSGKVVYEVFRIIAGIPLFSNDHNERLQNSCKMAQFGAEILPSINLKKLAADLGNGCGIFFGLAELKIYEQEGEVHFSLGFVDRALPTPLDYINGVSAEFLEAERENPNMKIKNTPLRDKAKLLLEHNTKIQELIYVNNQGMLTEGSRSNLFFLNNRVVYTAPGHTVLEGITRKYIIMAIERCGYELIEELVPKESLKKFDAAWISGTSRGILPLNRIGTYNFDPQNKELKALLIEFNTLLQEYLSGE